MSDLRQAAEMALEALESKYIVNCGAWMLQQDQAAEALRQAIEQAEDAVAAEREWVGLTDDDIDLYAFDIGVTDNKAPAWLVTYARGIEAKLKEKNVPQP